MSPRPPADAVIALRSLPRRARGLFAGLDADESPDALARRAGADGRSAVDHLAAASRALTAAHRTLDRVLVSEDPQLAVPVDAVAERGAGLPASGTLQEQLLDLQLASERLAARAEHVGASEWSRTARSPDGTTVTAADLLWRAVDDAVATLKAAEQALHEA